MPTKLEPTVLTYCTSRAVHSLQRAVGTDVQLVSPPGLAHAVTVPGIQNYAIARRCHLPPFPPPPIEQTASPTCSISSFKSVPSDSLKSALDRVHLHSPRRLVLNSLNFVVFTLVISPPRTKKKPLHQINQQTTTLSQAAAAFTCTLRIFFSVQKQTHSLCRLTVQRVTV